MKKEVKGFLYIIAGLTFTMVLFFSGYGFMTKNLGWILGIGIAIYGIRYISGTVQPVIAAAMFGLAIVGLLANAMFSITAEVPPLAMGVLLMIGVIISLWKAE